MSQETGYMLGKKIKQIRLGKGMTIQAVADKANITRSLVSQIENNKANPSINSLTAIAMAIGVPISSFFDEDDKHNTPVVKANERKELRIESGVTHYFLTPEIGTHKIEFLYNVFEKNGSTGKMYKHFGEECGIVLQGKLKVTHGEKEYVLEAGDSIILDSTEPHKYTNIHSGKTIAIWVDTPPRW
jgi:transcriptional regulator with XRE-family HTH domain